MREQANAADEELMSGVISILLIDRLRANADRRVTTSLSVFNSTLHRIIPAASLRDANAVARRARSCGE